MTHFGFHQESWHQLPGSSRRQGGGEQPWAGKGSGEGEGEGGGGRGRIERRSGGRERKRVALLQLWRFESQFRALGKGLPGYLIPCPVQRSVIGDVVCSVGRAPPLGWIRLSYPPDKLLVSSLNSSAFSLSLPLPLSHTLTPSLKHWQSRVGGREGGGPLWTGIAP